MDDHLNIEADLAYSEKLHGLTTGHQQETRQLLENIEQLQGDARLLLDENKALREENAAKDARIAELEARVSRLEAQPTNIYADQLVGVQNIAQQNVHNQLVTGNTRKRITKNKYLDLTNQLNIWPITTTSL